MSDARAARGHAARPADGRGVIAPRGDVLVLQVDEEFEDQVLEKEACHFEIVDGQVAAGVLERDETILDVLRPGEAPDDGANILASADPDAAGAAFAGVAEADVRRESRHQFANVGQAAGGFA